MGKLLLTSLDGRGVQRSARIILRLGCLEFASGCVEMEMIGGIMNTSRLALVAAAGVLLGAAVTPAKAADLGGGCCGDLEERVAELEATTARKGNRVVSLQVYGQVNKALLIFDDGVDSDAFIVDNDASGSRLGFTGKATIKPGWTAGYLLEFDYQDAASDKVFNGASGSVAQNGDDPNDEITIRYNNFYIESERLGRITLGQGSTAADGASEVVLGNSIKNSDIHHGTSFLIRNGSASTFSSVKLGDIAQNFDGGRDDVIRYDSPSIYGFIVSASWGDNDYADVALRFKKEFNSIRIAAAVAYQWDETEDAGVGTTTITPAFEALTGSISVQHIPTGIYGAFAAGSKEFTDLVNRDDATFWYAQLGIEKKFLPYGSTTVYGDYGIYKDTAFNGSEAERWGLGAVQKFDSAALEVYAQATFWSFDGTGPLASQDLSDAEDLTTVMIGSRLKF
jgi:predicted porin